MHMGLLQLAGESKDEGEFFNRLKRPDPRLVFLVSIPFFAYPFLFVSAIFLI